MALWRARYLRRHRPMLAGRRSNLLGRQALVPNGRHSRQPILDQRPVLPEFEPWFWGVIFFVFVINIFFVS